MHIPTPILASGQGIFAAMAMGIGLFGVTFAYQLGKQRRHCIVSIVLALFLVGLLGCVGYLLDHLFLVAPVPLFFFLGAYAEKHFKKEDA